jgi:hypothetical protein
MTKQTTPLISGVSLLGDWGLRIGLELMIRQKLLCNQHQLQPSNAFSLFGAGVLSPAPVMLVALGYPWYLDVCMNVRHMRSRSCHSPPLKTRKKVPLGVWYRGGQNKKTLRQT